jgi:hypothetical protein
MGIRKIHQHRVNWHVETMAIVWMNYLFQMVILHIWVCPRLGILSLDKWIQVAPLEFCSIAPVRLAWLKSAKSKVLRTLWAEDFKARNQLSFFLEKYLTWGKNGLDYSSHLSQPIATINSYHLLETTLRPTIFHMLLFCSTNPRISQMLVPDLRGFAHTWLKL